MAYCGNCGSPIDDSAQFCPKCGAKQGNAGYMSQPYGQPYTNDSGSFGWAILGFLIPLVGLILWLVWMHEKPKCAKMAGLGALVSVIAGIAFYVIIIIIAMMAGVTTTSALMFF